MNIRFFLAKSLRIPRRLHMIYYICFNRFKFWLNDVRFGSNMRVYNKIYLNKARSSKITIGDNFLFTSGEAKLMRPALLRMAIRYLEDSDEAEDAVQDALLKLWFLRDRLDQYRSVDALAIVITKHLCINRLRGTRIEKVDLEQGISIGGGENPEMKLVEEENMQEILEVIGTLPDLQQSILRMKHLEGFEVEEIARLTGSTPVAVRTNLSRARKRVKEQFMIHSKVWN